MEKLLTRAQVIDLPNTLLLDPQTGNAAAYNSAHRKITFQASPELVDYALSQDGKHAAWNPTAHTRPEWHPLPPWATEDVLKRCVLYWLRSTPMTDEQLIAMPRD